MDVSFLLAVIFTGCDDTNLRLPPFPAAKTEGLDAATIRLENVAGA